MAASDKNQKGFIPLVILLVVVMGIFIWFAYKHVSDNHAKKVVQTVQGYKNTLSQ